MNFDKCNCIPDVTICEGTYSHETGCPLHKPKKCEHDDITWDYENVDFSYDSVTVNGVCDGCKMAMYMYYQIDEGKREHVHSTLERKSMNFDCDALTVTYHCTTCYRNIDVWYHFDFVESDAQRNGEDKENSESEELEVNNVATL